MIDREDEEHEDVPQEQEEFEESEPKEEPMIDREDEEHEDVPQEQEEFEESEPKEEPMIEPSLEGLVKMTKDGKTIHAHPNTVAHHEGNGWKRA